MNVYENVKNVILFQKVNILYGKKMEKYGQRIVRFGRGFLDEMY